jgi:hypothetical protein
MKNELKSATLIAVAEAVEWEHTFEPVGLKRLGRGLSSIPRSETSSKEFYLLATRAVTQSPVMTLHISASLLYVIRSRLHRGFAPVIPQTSLPQTLLTQSHSG